MSGLITSSEIRQILQEMVHNYVTKKIGWCQETQFIDYESEDLKPFGLEAKFVVTNLYARGKIQRKVVSADIYGALRIAIRQLDTEKYDSAIVAFQKLFHFVQPPGDILAFNDNKDTTLHSVIMVLNRMTRFSHMVDILDVMES